MSDTLVIRADASRDIGTGHVMRCLALAQAWMARGGAVCWAATAMPEALTARLAREGIFARMIDPRLDALATSALADEAGASWIIVDGYNLDGSYERAIGHRVLAWDDDVHTDHAACALVLNQNIHAKASMYPTVVPERVLAGPSFAQLRREFWPLRTWKRTHPATARRLLITMGGSDPTGVTRRLVDAIAGRSGLDVTVVIGSAARFDPLLLAAVERAKFRLVTDPPSMPELMAQADLALAAGGSTSWELAFMGLPSLVVTLADNQRPIAEALGSAGVAVALGWHADLDFVHVADTVSALAGDLERRNQMSALGRALVDGNGGARVLDAMKGAA